MFKLDNKKGPPLCGALGLLAESVVVNTSNSGPASSERRSSSRNKKSTVAWVPSENWALKKRLLGERAALEVFVWVSYKRRLVLRGGVEVIVAKKVARLKHEVYELDGKVSKSLETHVFPCHFSKEICERMKKTEPFVVFTAPFVMLSL
ncbi:hypothetical protein [Hymenobacter arizonensis]|uniref:hypothetical protein n=1 Tax=Hymenobacter arizonensis TaxID=1227077 RepID=UPI0011604D05|nr:hypothetical protein [Hymenobacter arizonensis]